MLRKEMEGRKVGSYLFSNSEKQESCMAAPLCKCLCAEGGLEFCEEKCIISLKR